MEGWDVSLTFGTPSFTDYNNMSEEQSLKQKTAKGLFWGGLSSSIQQLLGLLFGIVLGRLLDRSDLWYDRHAGHLSCHRFRSAGKRSCGSAGQPREGQR